MDLFSALDISASGLEVQTCRMNVISSNLANVHSTRSPEGGPYKRQALLVAADPMNSPFEAHLDREVSDGARRVRVLEIIEDPSVKLVYMPHHPDSNSEGYVAFPKITVMEEMVDMMMATRSYEANIQAVGAVKGMFNKALEIGK